MPNWLTNKAGSQNSKVDEMNMLNSLKALYTEMDKTDPSSDSYYEAMRNPASSTWDCVFEGRIRSDCPC